jgi:hypothetical protein
MDELLMRDEVIRDLYSRLRIEQMTHENLKLRLLNLGKERDDYREQLSDLKKVSVLNFIRFKYFNRKLRK